jgi:2-polyprenylphenol 6-hydroxylase
MSAIGQQPDHDVVIVGAGLVGLSLAAALARSGLSVAIVDRHTIAAANEDDTHADNWDSRVYAVSPGSAEFLHGQGVWQRVPAERIAPIHAMEIYGDDRGHVSFDAYDLGERSLAWIVENRELNAALVAAVRAIAEIEVLAPCVPESIAWRGHCAEIRLAEGRLVTARLVVGADGVHSWVRREAGMLHEPQPYHQQGVVANFATEVAHRGRAFQWFLGDRGVLAWLPLPGKRMSIVWSAPDALAAELLTLDPAALAGRVADAGGHALGRLEMICAAAGFPLSLLKLPFVVSHRFALIGDAAHGVHPLAGQGVNLGFGDAAALAAVLGGRGAVGDVGTPILLERYARRRAAPVLAMQTVTDGLVRLFGMPAPWAQVLRNRGMRAVDAVRPLKRLLAQPALR